MADYTQYPYIDKRVRYFDGEFLKDQDFIDEQKYHIDRKRRLDQFLRVSGICDGLTLKTDTNQVIVTPGTALDSEGRQIILSTDSSPINLSGYQSQEVYLVISYQEEQSDQTTDGGLGSSGARRWHEKPNIQVATLGNVPEDSIVLAKLAIAGNGTVTPDLSVRQYSGVRLPSGNLDSGAITGPTLRSGGNSASSLVVIDGDLSVTGDTTLDSHLSVTGNTTLNNLTIDDSATLSFHKNMREMINLWDQRYGIGIQSHTQYFRTAKNFAWYKDGSHHDNELNPGDGTVQMVIKDGKVGIGTNDPGSSKLKVQGNLTVSAGNIQLDGAQQIVFTNNDTSNNLKLQLWGGYGLGINSSTLFYAANGKHSWRDTNGTNERMALSTAANGGLTVKGTGNSSFAGNLGIGTTDPGSSKLKVQGKLTVSAGNIQLDGAQQIVFTNNDTSNNLKLQLWGGYGLGINGSTLFYAANGNHSWRDDDGTNERMVLTTAANGGLTVKGTGNSSFAGNLGIGTTDPGSSKLKVQGNLTVTGNATLESLTLNDNFSLGGSNTLSFGSQVRQMINLWNQDYGIGVQSGTQYFRTATNFAWYKGGSHNDNQLNAGGGTVQMVIKNGNVGIGTTDPNQMLDVVTSTSYNNRVVARFYRPSDDTAALIECGDSNEAFIQFKNQTTGSDSWMAGMDDDEKFKIAYGSTEITTSNSKFTVEQDGDVRISGGLYVTDVPYGDHKNAQWNSGTGQLYHDNSSAKTKENIISLEDDFEKILTVEPKTYTRPNDPNRWEIGYIAEEFNEIGLNKLVYYDEQGLPEAINYRKISMYLVEVIKDMAHKSSNYEQRINQLELQLNQLVSDD